MFRTLPAWTGLPILVMVAPACQSDTPMLAPIQPPALELVSPAGPGMRAEGPVLVTGEASSLTDLRINGEPAELENSTFSRTIALSRGMNLIEARGTDSEGHDHFERQTLLAGEFGDATAPITDAIVMRINQAGLTEAMGLLPTLLDVDELTAQAMENNPLAESEEDASFSYMVTLDELTLGTPYAIATPTPGELVIQLVVPDLYVDIAVSLGAMDLFDVTTDVVTTIDKIVVDVPIRLAAEDGMPVVEIDALDVRLVDFAVDTGFIPYDWESSIPLLENSIRQFIEQFAEQAAVEQIPGMIDEVLAGLDLSFEQEAEGTPIRGAASFGDLSVDDFGVRVAIDLELTIGEEAKTRDGSGFLTSPNPTPPEDLTSPIAMLINDNVLNRAMYSAWAAGMMDLSLATEDGSLDPEMLSDLEAEEGSVKTFPALPPVAVQQGDTLAIQLGGFDALFETPGGGFGETLRMAVTGGIPLAPTVIDGDITLSVGQPDLSVFVRETDWRPSREAISNLMEAKLPVDALDEAAAKLAIPLPAIQGVTIDDVNIGRSNNGLWTVATMSITPAEEQ